MHIYDRCLTNCAELNPLFYDQFLRTLGKSYVQMADIGECVAALNHIQDGDFESWYSAWHDMAHFVRMRADESHKLGHFLSAAYAYLRASEYYRASEFFLRHHLDDKRIIPCYDALQFCFGAAIKTLQPEHQKITIPYQSRHLQGYLFRTKDEPKGLLVFPGGYDSTVEENYHLVPAALAHGYHIFIFDAPGQGHALRRNQLLMRPDFEVVLKLVLDGLEQEVGLLKLKKILIGRSFGGYLAPRAACFESRLSGLVCDPGQIDMKQSLKKQLPETAYALLQRQQANALNQFFKEAFQKDPLQAFFFHSRMQVHGAQTVYEYFNILQEYTFLEYVGQIDCPTLVCINPNDPLSHQAQTFYDALQCDKQYFIFQENHGAGTHCESIAHGQFQSVLFDWLDMHFGE